MYGNLQEKYKNSAFQIFQIQQFLIRQLRKNTMRCAIFRN